MPGNRLCPSPVRRQSQKFYFQENLREFYRREQTSLLSRIPYIQLYLYGYETLKMYPLQMFQKDILKLQMYRQTKQKPT